MSEKIRFQTNIPVEVALKYADGKDVTGDYSDQVLYSLTDGRTGDVCSTHREEADRGSRHREGRTLYRHQGRREIGNAPDCQIAGNRERRAGTCRCSR